MSRSSGREGDGIGIPHEDDDHEDATEGRMTMGSRKTASLAVEPGGASKSGEQREGRKRVQIDFSPTAYARLDAIRERSEAHSNAETVRNALRLYDWFLRQRDEGYEVRLVKGDEERAVELLW